MTTVILVLMVLFVLGFVALFVVASRQAAERERARIEFAQAQGLAYRDSVPLSEKPWTTHFIFSKASELENVVEGEWKRVPITLATTTETSGGGGGSSVGATSTSAHNVVALAADIVESGQLYILPDVGGAMVRLGATAAAKAQGLSVLDDVPADDTGKRPLILSNLPEASAAYLFGPGAPLLKCLDSAAIACMPGWLLVFPRVVTAHREQSDSLDDAAALRAALDLATSIRAKLLA